MTAYFNLTLDTHAPVVTWGAVDTTNPGDTMHVAYTVDEPGVLSADVLLSDNRVVPGTVQAGVLIFDLPLDAPEGPAQVRAYVGDDVGNNATRTLALVVGQPVTPPPAPAPAPGPGWGGRPAPKPVLLSDRSSASCASRTRTHVTQVRSSRLVARSRYIAPSERVRRSASRALAASTARVAVASPPLASAALGSGKATLWKRPEGPGAEEDFILLGLL